MKSNKPKLTLAVDNADEDSIRFHKKLQRAYALFKEGGHDNERGLKVVGSNGNKSNQDTSESSHNQRTKKQLGPLTIVSDNRREIAERLLRNIFMGEADKVDEDFKLLKRKKSTAMLKAVKPVDK